MKSKLFCFASALLAICSTNSQAALVDLSTAFIFNASADGNDSIAPNLITMNGSLVAGTRTPLDIYSFEYNFTYANPPRRADARLFLGSFPTGTQIAIGAAAGGTTGTTGWLTYTLPAPLNTQINFILNNLDGGNEAQLLIRNVQSAPIISAIPEPGTPAMLLAGLGMLGFIARRNPRRADGQAGSAFQRMACF